MVCPKCNNVINDNVAICPVCGNQLTANNAQNQNVYQNQNVNYTQPLAPDANAYQYQQNVPTQRKKGKIPKWVPVLIACIYILVIAVAVAVVMYLKGGSGKNSGFSASSHNAPYGSASNFIDRFVPETNKDPNKDPNKAISIELPPETEIADEAAPEISTTVPEDEYIPEADAEAIPEADAEAIPEAEEIPETVEPVPDNRRLVIATGGLNLRSSPSSKSKSKGLIPDGSIILVESEYDGWAYTYFEGEYGWCSAEFLFVPVDYDLELLHVSRVALKSGLELIVQDHMVGSRNAKTTVPFDHYVYVYKIEGSRAFVSYNNIYGWCDMNGLQLPY